MVNKKRLIDANYLVNKLIPNCPIEDGGIPLKDFDTHQKILALYPTVDAVEVKHGRWERVEEFEFISGEYVTTGYHCSKCGYYYKKKSNYCPNCGAKSKNTTQFARLLIWQHRLQNIG